MNSAHDVATDSDAVIYRELKVHLAQSQANTNCCQVMQNAGDNIKAILGKLSPEFRDRNDAEIFKLLQTYKETVLRQVIFEVRVNTSSVKDFSIACSNAKKVINYFVRFNTSCRFEGVGPEESILKGYLKAAVGQAATVVIEGISVRLSEALNGRKDSGKNYGCFYTALDGLTCVLKLVDELGYRNQENRGAENALRTMMHEALTKEKLKAETDLVDKISSGAGAWNLVPLLDIISSWNIIVSPIKECEDLIGKVNASDNSQIPPSCLDYLSNRLLGAIKNTVRTNYEQTIFLGVHKVSAALEAFFQELPNKGNDLKDKKPLVRQLGDILNLVNKRVDDLSVLEKAWLKAANLSFFPDRLKPSRRKLALGQYIYSVI